MPMDERDRMRGGREGQAPEPGFSLNDLHMELLTLHHLQRCCLRPIARGMGLGPGQPRMLSYLGVMGASTQRDIAAHFQVDAAAVSRMLDALAKNGFVHLTPGPDRRTKVAALTGEGERALARWDEACRTFDEAALAGFTAAERAQLEDLLSRLRANIDAQARTRKGGAAHA